MAESIVKPFVTPRELAEALGLGESSIKRWADEGRITVGRTAGGHRRIAIAEAIRFVRESGLPLIHPQPLGLPAVQAGTEAALMEETPDAVLHRLLTEGREEEVRRLVLGEFFAGRSIARIADELVAPPMETIGELWKKDTGGIFIEHRAYEICAQSARLLMGYIPRPPDDAPMAVGGAPSGDLHALPSLLASAVLLENGFHAVNLGAETPFEVLEIALRTYRPKLTWVSTTLHDAQKNGAAIAEGVRRLARKARAWGGEVMIGGRGVPEALHSSRISNLLVCRSMTDLDDRAKSLRGAADRETLPTPPANGN